MKRYTVVFAPEAAEQLATLYHFISERSSPAIALRYTSAIIDHCEGMATLPQRGVPRDDIRPNLRLTHYRGRAVIAYAVEDDRVSILGVYYGGQDYESALESD